MNLGLFVVEGHHQGNISDENFTLKNWNSWNILLNVSFIAWDINRHLNKKNDKHTHIG